MKNEQYNKSNGNYKVFPIDTFDTKEWLLKKHYAHRMCPISYAFGLFENNVIVGVCTYGHPFSPGLKKCLGEAYHDTLLELNRLCVNDNLPKNTLSWFVSQTFKFLPKPVPIVSFADSEQGHHGYIYQATNWIYTGLSVPFTDVKVKGFEHLHQASIGDKVGRADKNENVAGKSRKKLLEEKFGKENIFLEERARKHRYFMFLGSKSDKKKMLKCLTYKIQPYPKGDNKTYDSSYEPKVQLSLF